MLSAVNKPCYLRCLTTWLFELLDFSI